MKEKLIVHVFRESLFDLIVVFVALDCLIVIGLLIPFCVYILKYMRLNVGKILIILNDKHSPLKFEIVKVKPSDVASYSYSSQLVDVYYTSTTYNM